MKPHPPAVEPLEGRTLLSTQSVPTYVANPVVAWNFIALQAIREAKATPPAAARDLAIIQASVFDAVNSIDPTGPAYRVRIKAPAGASLEAAVAAAADAALDALFPSQTKAFDSGLAQAVAGLPRTQGTAAGLAVGKAVAAAELALRHDDGSAAHADFTPTAAVGKWVPTPPAYAPALLPQWGQVTPFVLKSGSQFLPPPPPAPSSAAYAAAVDEVESLGSKASTTRTADQTRIALFWADGAGTETPPGHWNAIAEQVSIRRHDSIATAARVFAVLDLALADAAIACWDAKFGYDFWRPITAIREADLDGNPGTAADPAWTPLLTTPNFPSYISGHSTFSAAAAVVLSAFYGPNTHFTATSDGLPGVARSFSSFSAAAAEAGMSRIYAGIHFPFDNQAGLVLGRSVGAYVLHHAFRNGGR